MSLIVELVVEAPAWAAVAGLQELTERAVAAALAESEPDLAGDIEVSCLFTDDAAIRALNAQWRGQDKPTNVLSFPAADPGVPGAARLLGDIVLAFETVEREAREDAKALDAHVTHLVVHGVLHLVGHDHEEPAEAEAMEALETHIMHSLGRPNPYADRPLVDTP